MNVDVSEQIDKEARTYDTQDYVAKELERLFPVDRESFPAALNQLVQYLKQWHQEKAEEHLSIVDSLSRIPPNLLRGQ